MGGKDEILRSFASLRMATWRIQMTTWRVPMTAWTIHDDGVGNNADQF
jgi:hypothetical protein